MAGRMVYGCVGCRWVCGWLMVERVVNRCVAGGWVGDE